MIWQYSWKIHFYFILIDLNFEKNISHTIHAIILYLIAVDFGNFLVMLVALCRFCIYFDELMNVGKGKIMSTEKTRLQIYFWIIMLLISYKIKIPESTKGFVSFDLLK